MVRFVDGRIAERSPLGDDRAFDYGRDSNRLAVIYWSPSDGRRISFWDLASGKRLADSVVTGPAIVARKRSIVERPHNILRLDPTGRKAIVSDGYDCGSIDLSNGKKASFKPPGRAFGDFDQVKNQVGLRLKTGEFVPYLVETDTFGEPIRFEGIVGEWTSYVRGVGLTRNEKVNGHNVLIQLSDDSLKPLAEKRPLNFAPPGRQGFGALPDGRPFVFSYSSIESGQTTVVIRDMQTERELLNQDFDFDPDWVETTEDGHAFVMVDRNRRALHFDQRNQKTTLTDYSVLREPNPENKPERETRLIVIPYFGATQRPEKARE